MSLHYLSKVILYEEENKEYLISDQDVKKLYKVRFKINDRSRIKRDWKCRLTRTCVHLLVYWKVTSILPSVHCCAPFQDDMFKRVQ